MHRSLYISKNSKYANREKYRLSASGREGWGAKNIRGKPFHLIILPFFSKIEQNRKMNH